MDNKMKIQEEQYWENRKLNNKSDWGTKETWIDSYWSSRLHPHRKLIIKELEKLKPFHSLLEVGCNVGPNLSIIQETFRGEYLKLAGIDVNKNAIFKGQELLPEANLVVGKADDIPFNNKTFDIVLTDAVLIYISPKKIEKVISELIRIAKKAIILCEWYDKSKFGKIKFYHWCRNYPVLFKDYNVKVIKKKIPKGLWPTKSKNWEKIGYLFVCHLLSPISKKK